MADSTRRGGAAAGPAPTFVQSKENGVSDGTRAGPAPAGKAAPVHGTPPAARTFSPANLLTRLVRKLSQFELRSSAVKVTGAPVNKPAAPAGQPVVAGSDAKRSAALLSARAEKEWAVTGLSHDTIAGLIRHKVTPGSYEHMRLNCPFSPEVTVHLLDIGFSMLEVISVDMHLPATPTDAELARMQAIKQELGGAFLDGLFNGEVAKRLGDRAAADARRDVVSEAIPSTYGDPPATTVLMQTVRDVKDSGPARSHGRAAAEKQTLREQYGIPESVAAFGLHTQNGLAQKFASGGLNKIYQVPVTSNQGYSSHDTLLCKPLRSLSETRAQPKEIGMISKLGVPKERPQSAERNLASRALDVLLRQRQASLPEVIVHAELMQLQRQGHEPVLALAMPLARGNVLFHTRDADIRLPEVRRQLTLLQLQDGIAGQADRNTGNVLVDVDDARGVRVTGIDNDQSWGNNTSAETLIRYSKGYKGVGWPRVIDRDQFAAVRSLTEKDLRAILEPLGLAASIAPAAARLAELHRYLDDGQIRVIEPDQWSSLTSSADAPSKSRSYDGRRLYQCAHGDRAVPERSPFAPVRDAKGSGAGKGASEEIAVAAPVLSVTVADPAAKPQTKGDPSA